MKEERFWEIVEKIDWAKRSKQKNGAVGAALYVATIMPQEESKGFNDIIEAKFAVVAKLAELRVSLGDDSFGDLCYHVIGLGKDFYEKTVANPDSLKVLKFKESFAYCLPNPEDYKMIDGSYFEDKTREFVDRIYVKLLDLAEKLDQKTQEAIDSLSDTVILLQEGKYLELPSSEEVVTTWEQLSRGVLTGNIADFQAFSEAVEGGRYWFERLVVDARRAAEARQS